VHAVARDAAGGVFTLVDGYVTNEELLAHQQRMAANPDFGQR